MKVTVAFLHLLFAAESLDRAGCIHIQIDTLFIHTHMRLFLWPQTLTFIDHHLH